MIADPLRDLQTLLQPDTPTRGVVVHTTAQTARIATRAGLIQATPGTPLTAGQTVRITHSIAYPTASATRVYPL